MHSGKKLWTKSILTKSNDGITVYIKDEGIYNEVLEKINLYGYTENDEAKNIGDYARRGGIIDVFPNSVINPIRLEFDNNSILDDIPNTYPAMLKSYKIQKKVTEVGFDYISKSEAIDKIIEEAKELKKEIQKNNVKKIKEELGDLLFSCLDVSRKLKLNPEIILSNANKKFTKRWKFVEKEAEKQKINIKKIDLNKFNKLWNLSKKIN